LPNDLALGICISSFRLDPSFFLMRIALVILHADPKRGGAERYTADLAGALAKRGHDVSLLATSFADTPPQVKILELSAKGFTRTKRYQSMLDSLDAQLNAGHFEIVHAMLPVRRCDVYHPHAGMASKSIAVAPVSALFNPRRGAMAQVERSLLTTPATAPVVLCLSDYVKRDVRKFYPNLPDDRLATLFNAVNLNYFDPNIDHDGGSTRQKYRIADKDVVALIIAQDFARKGVSQAIGAVQKINAQRGESQPTLKLVVVGDGPHSVEDENIIFAGTSWKIAKFYSAANFFVLPTKHDPCSLVVLEALAMGLPVISTVFNGACEIMTDGVHGFVLPDPNDVDALAGAMGKMLDVEVRNKMSAKCLELRAALSYEAHLDRLMQIYQRCAVESRGDALSS
jgi:UDP-glucose:(heptosyl)LPS alpha-1,3-glucosyltransferase